MRASDETKNAYIATLAAILGADSAADLKVELEVLERRYFRELDQRILDRETARLLPLGVEVAAERKHCHRSTVYRRASRAKSVARLLPSATLTA